MGSPSPFNTMLVWPGPTSVLSGISIHLAVLLGSNLVTDRQRDDSQTDMLMAIAQSNRSAKKFRLDDWRREVRPKRGSIDSRQPVVAIPGQ